jgi:eukaryotic-like serine/threonine-protein kinase
LRPPVQDFHIRSGDPSLFDHVMATTLTCLGCGENVRSGDRFCSRCGDELALSSHPTALLDSDAHLDDDPDSPWAEVVHRLRRATFGEFEIGRELGRGGMAAVFLAHEISLDRKVAIKVMSPGLLMGDGMIDRFKREAITIAHLNHPNIVSCYSVRQAEGLHFFVMRYIRGRSLEQLIHEAGKLPVPIVRSILCQVGSALTYAHRSRVVHRDIKPANILIDEDGNAVVTDFGIAKVAELPGHTHTGALVGTPAYMSPEQCSGAEVSGASDQYSLGAVAYEMVAGVAPFTGSTLTVMQAQVEHTPPPIRERCPDCPAEFEAAILRMLAKDPAERFPSMAEAKAALGATPLMEDDPLLGELCRLAAAGSPESISGTPVPSGPAPAIERSSASRAALAGQARSIVILPPPAELAKGDGFALVALVRGERGVPLPGRTVQWSTDAPAVLHIDQARSVATALAPGSAMLTASCDGIQTRVPVHVPPVAEPLDLDAGAPAAAIQISSPPKSVRAGDSFVLTATPLDSLGRPLPEPAVLWNTSDVRVAVVAAGGWVAALGRGHVVLTATRGGASASVNIDVAAAIPTQRPARPPVRSVQPSDPAPFHRSSRRRRGSRVRRGLVNVALGAIAILASAWLFGGMRDFRWDRGQPSAHALDTVQGVTDDATRRAEPTESIAPINRGAAASAAPRLRRVRPRRTQPPAPASLSIAAHDPIRAGDTVTLTAVVIDSQGEPIGGAGVTWRSSEPELADVDSATGKVRGQTPGAALIVARSGAATATSELVVLPPVEVPPEPSGYVPLTPDLDREPVPEEIALAPPAGRAVADPPLDRRQLESRMREGVEDCYGAVRAKDLDRLAKMYHPKTYADEDQLRRLARILRTEPWKAVVGKRVDGARELGARVAAAEFSFRLAWRDSHGGRLSSQPIFRAEFARGPDGWAMSSCRIVGSPKL